MVKRKTKTRLEALEFCFENLLKRVEELEENKKEKQDENNKIEKWLSDERLDDVQQFLHKGVK